MTTYKVYKLESIHSGVGEGVGVKSGGSRESYKHEVRLARPVPPPVMIGTLPSRYLNEPG